jgi:hypothetical protein
MTSAQESPLASVRKAVRPVIDAYEQHVHPHINRVLKNPQVQRISGWASTYAHTVARLLVCMYFVNLSVTNFNYWWLYNLPGIPWTALPMLPCAIAVAFNRKV